VGYSGVAFALYKYSVLLKSEAGALVKAESALE
jgi:hypothetical protein